MREMAEAAWGMAPCAACLCIQMVLSRNRGKCLFSPDIVRLEIAPSGIEDECQAAANMMPQRGEASILKTGSKAKPA